jgi:hypothetical protein
MVVLDAVNAESGRATSTRSRQRHDWVRADVRCLMCGRLQGRLLGTARRTENGERTAGHPVAFFAYRALDPVERIVPFTPNLRFRCRVCSGAGAVDSVDVFSTYDEPPATDEEMSPDGERIPRGPGRPRRPFLPLKTSGVHSALNHL